MQLQNFFVVADFFFFWRAEAHFERTHLHSPDTMDEALNGSANVRATSLSVHNLQKTISFYLSRLSAAFYC